MSNDALAKRLCEEVETLHIFIAAWYRGEHPKDRALFAEHLGDHLAPGMINIQPAGRALTREALIAAVYDGCAANPAFEIEIEDFRLITTSPDGALAVARYVEAQRGAKNSKPENRRLSTVVFRRDGDRYLWAHLHETGLD